MILTIVVQKTVIKILVLLLFFVLAGFLSQVHAGSESAGSGQFNGPPRIFIVLPTSGPGFVPVGIGGTNFDNDNAPFFGSLSSGFTIIPPSAEGTPGNVIVEYFGQRSNPFPFSKN